MILIDSVQYVRCPYCMNKYTDLPYLKNHLIGYHQHELSGTYSYLTENGYPSTIPTQSELDYEEIREIKISLTLRLIEDSQGKFVIYCPNCGQKLKEPIPSILYEDFQGNRTSILDDILFCSDSCCTRYLKLKKEEHKCTGNPDTAQQSRQYRDQYDWNR